MFLLCNNNAIKIQLVFLYHKGKLARNVTENGLMTSTGGMKKGDHDIGWIPPMGRVQEELGMKAKWKRDGTIEGTIRTV